MMKKSTQLKIQGYIVINPLRIAKRMNEYFREKVKATLEESKNKYNQTELSKMNSDEVDVLVRLSQD